MNAKLSELRKKGDKDKIIYFLINLLHKFIYTYKPKVEDYIFMTKDDELNKILEGIPTTIRPEVELAKFVHDSEQNKWRQIKTLLNSAILLGKFRATAPPTISETGSYPLSINDSGELEVALSATSELNVNVEDIETLLTDIKTIITYTGDDFETVQDAIRTAVENLTFSGDSFETVIDGLKTQIDALKAQIDKFTFDGSNNLKIVAG